MTKKAVGYCRISTNIQLDNTSLKDQEDKIRAYGNLHNIEISEIFTDKALSGKADDRPEYDKMIDYVKENDIDFIIVYKNDRIHRSLYNLLTMINDLQKYNVSLVSVTENFDTSTPQGMLLLQMLASFAEFERAIITERSLNGRIAKLNELVRIEEELPNSLVKTGNISFNTSFDIFVVAALSKYFIFISCSFFTLYISILN